MMETNNAATMRSAIKETLTTIERVMEILNDIPEHCGYDGLVEDVADEMCALRESCNDALSAPSRNSDSFKDNSRSIIENYNRLAEKVKTVVRNSVDGTCRSVSHMKLDGDELTVYYDICCRNTWDCDFCTIPLKLIEGGCEESGNMV